MTTAARTDSPSFSPRLAKIARILLAGLGGVAVYFSYEPHGLAFMGVLGIALFYLALAPWPAIRHGSHPPAKFGALLGFLHGFCAYVLLLPWVGEFVGALPWIALSITLALWSIVTGLFGVLVARWRYGFIAFAFVYSAVEFLLSSFPFGGFSWVRLAWGQINGPLANYAPWGGPALVTFMTALLGASFGAILLSFAGDERLKKTPATATTGIIIGLGFLAGLGVNTPGPTTDEVKVAAVQGNVPRMGLDFNAQRRAVLANHVNVTKDLGASGENPDLVFWPENSSDVNPFRDREARDLITEAVDTVDAPVLVGTLTKDEVGDRNTAVVFDPDTGAGDMHHKRFLQPFGEWMPMRDFFRIFSSYVDMAGDFKPGDGDGTVRMGDHVVGVATCYEVAFDAAYRDAVKAGAQILTTPTNNATFGFTDMTYQQLAMSRMRAIETDRAVVVSATSGASAIVHPDGTVSQETEIFTPAYLVEDLPLRDSVTFAVRYGQFIQWLLAAAGIAVMLAASVGARRGYASSRSQQLADTAQADNDN